MKPQITTHNTDWKQFQQTFATGKSLFAGILKNQRSAFIMKMLEAKPSVNPPPIVFKQEYPQSGKYNYQNYSLHYHSIQQNKTPKAILVHFHGLNSHGGPSGFYANVIAKQNPSLNVYSLDQMNFGQSEGPFRGQIQSLDESVNQCSSFIDFIMSKYQQKPKIFLSGSSYGGSIIFKMIVNQQKKYAGAILLAPGLRNLSQSQPYLKKIGKFLGWLMPRTRLFTQKFEGGTKYNNEQLIKEDPYYYKDRVVPGSIKAVLDALDQVSTLYSKFNVPYIAFQSGVQKMTDPFAVLDLQQESPSNDKTTIYCQKMWHSTFSQEQIQGISQIAAHWLKQRI